MKGLAFELKGRFAFFKKPDVNANIYFTYSHIHKVALLGLLGAIVGLGGYIQQHNRKMFKNEDIRFPEFYEKLKDLKVGIIPHGEFGYFTKKIYQFNNAVGYANKDGNLIVKEQWLENPHWTIYLFNEGTVDVDLYQTLELYLLHHQSVFNPYLGKNDHPAKIEQVRNIDFIVQEKSDYLHSLFPSSISIDRGEIETWDGENPYFFKEFVPTQLHAQLNNYTFEEMVYTNLKVLPISQNIYQAENKNIFLF